MGAAQIHDECICCGEVLSSAHDIAVQNILCLAIYNWTPEDCPWDGLTRSMRYAAVMGNCLWEMLHLEQQRVGALICCLFGTTNRITRETTWSKSSVSYSQQ